MQGLSAGEIVAVVLPLVLIQLGLVVWALVDLSGRNRVRGGSRLLWLLIIVFFEFFGSILYLAWGRRE